MKEVCDFKIVDKKEISSGYVRLVLRKVDGSDLPEIKPGQFVNVAVPDSPSVFLRRPISINRVSDDRKDLHLLIRVAGEGTRKLCGLKEGDILNLVLPLGNGFTMSGVKGKRVLLIGGGVGVAPLLYYGECLVKAGAQVTFLLGARTVSDLLLREDFEAVAHCHYTTEDGSCGLQGFVTASPLTDSDSFDIWAVCGPLPMMKVVAAKSRNHRTQCFVSLENTMACGVGACLCCVEKTKSGNECVCTRGPIFEINELEW